MRARGSRSSLGVRSRAVGGSVGQISHSAGPHPLTLGVRGYPLFPLGEKQTTNAVPGMVPGEILPIASLRIGRARSRLAAYTW